MIWKAGSETTTKVHVGLVYRGLKLNLIINVKEKAEIKTEVKKNPLRKNSII